jgi:hypothetical protein
MNRLDDSITSVPGDQHRPQKLFHNSKYSLGYHPKVIHISMMKPTNDQMDELVRG